MLIFDADVDEIKISYEKMKQTLILEEIKYGNFNERTLNIMQRKNKKVCDRN